VKISEQDLLILAETYHVQSHDKTSSLIQFCEELIALAQEVEPGVKEEPFCYTHKNAQVEFDHGLSARIADFQDDYWSIPLYLHPPTASDLVERIRALEIAEPMGWMDRCHNSVVAKIVELIEGEKCTTQND
jgi:hypothetical protein